ncbi:MAG: aminotransferase class I/II-fold pyridoxal phosphate-dependent enzyme, partial [Xanthomonadales bacterium]|nr:aminotransferase class I/II-fold pyridoxal phosphate-dependent enzyme [Xanthomonadales bacterium]
MTAQRTSLADWLAGAARSRERSGLARTRSALVPASPVEVLHRGQTLVNFSSNDYLGLAGDPALISALQRGAQAHGVGSGASALVTGFREPHAALESELAEFLGYPRVLLCASGYHANLAAMGALAGRGDVIVQDRLCHASLIDGARLSGADLRRYPHADIAALDRQLQRGAEGHALVVSDGVFSMDGDQADVAALAEICARHDAWLMVDDAHGIGVTGPDGRGTVAAAGLGPEQVPVLV